LYDGACFLTRYIVGDHIERTIVGINILRVGAWPGGGADQQPSLIPAACLAMGIASHLGLQGVANLPVDQFIAVKQGALLFQGPVYSALITLFGRFGQLTGGRITMGPGSGITDGMTRDEVRQRLTDYLLPTTIANIEREHRKNGQ
jgi:hypothetical protein